MAEKLLRYNVCETPVVDKSRKFVQYAEEFGSGIAYGIAINYVTSQKYLDKFEIDSVLKLARIGAHTIMLKEALRTDPDEEELDNEDA